MRVKLLKAVYVRDGLRAAGEVLELDQETANGLVLLGAAEPLKSVKEVMAAEPAPAVATEPLPAVVTEPAPVVVTEPAPAVAPEASEEQAAEPQARSKRRKE